MTVYFYHTQDTKRIYREWQEGTFPAHLLYGATHLPEQGIEVILHTFPPELPNHRLRLMWKTLWRILRCKQKFQAVYATSFRGLELLILLRAMHLYRRPIVIWHHQPVTKAKNRLRELLARFFYRGIDHMIFFSQNLLETSLQSKKARAERLHVVHWGADLDFYDSILAANPADKRSGFISTGKEQRDMNTLVEAFRREGAPLDIYVNPKNGDIDYTETFGKIELPENVHTHFIRKLMIGELAGIVAKAQCIVICCRPTNYTVGLTTLVEALALGIPVICTNNTTIPIDIQREGCGIVVDYGDVEGWQRAVRYVCEHPAEAAAMGQRGRELTRHIFNIRQTTAEVAQVLNHAL